MTSYSTVNPIDNVRVMQGKNTCLFHVTKFGVWLNHINAFIVIVLWSDQASDQAFL